MRLLSYCLNSRLFLVNVFSIKLYQKNKIILVCAFFVRTLQCYVKDFEEENSKYNCMLFVCFSCRRHGFKRGDKARHEKVALSLTYSTIAI